MIYTPHIMLCIYPVLSKVRAMSDDDRQPPLQATMLEVLAARHRLGETSWNFPREPAYVVAAKALDKAGLATWDSGSDRIWVNLTDAGRALYVRDDTYTAPLVRKTLDRAAESAVAALLKEYGDNPNHEIARLITVAVTAIANRKENR